MVPLSTGHACLALTDFLSVGGIPGQAGSRGQEGMGSGLAQLTGGLHVFALHPGW